ncbi:MAG: YceI family protein [Dehalococcoidia bacterium]|nr:YceI family protein [Dehalococcoidia bacterium]
MVHLTRTMAGLPGLGLMLAACAPAAPQPAPVAPATPAPAAVIAPACFTLNADLSEARYRVIEQFVNVPLPSDAVGITKMVKGSVVFGSNGKVDPAHSKVLVDLGSIKSDRANRDRDINTKTLEVEKFPNAEFTIRDIKGLGAPMPAAGSRELELVGDLSIHGVSVPVTWKATAQFTETQVKGLATTAVTFAPFGMQNPKSQFQLSVEDNIRLELEFVFTKS